MASQRALALLTIWRAYDLGRVLEILGAVERKIIFELSEQVLKGDAAADDATDRTQGHRAVHAGPPHRHNELVHSLISFFEKALNG